MFRDTYLSILDARGPITILLRILIFLYDIFEFTMDFAVRAVTVYQGIHLDLCEMQCHVTVYTFRLAIDLKSDPSVAAALYSLASTRMAHRTANAQLHLVQVCGTL